MCKVMTRARIRNKTTPGKQAGTAGLVSAALLSALVLGQPVNGFRFFGLAAVRMRCAAMRCDATPCSRLPNCTVPVEFLRLKGCVCGPWRACVYLRLSARQHCPDEYLHKVISLQFLLPDDTVEGGVLG